MRISLFPLAIALTILAASSTSQAAVYSPPDPLTFNIWTGANESWFQYPETSPSSSYAIPVLLFQPNLGIALSGGGFRAATLGLGWLRALSSLNITASARYLASNSGGSWLNAAFSFQDKVALDTFLGPYIPPQQLSTQQLQKNPPEGSFERVIADASVTIAGAVGAVTDAVSSLVAGEQQGVGAWSSTVGEAFLEPYGLNSDASTFTAAGTAGPVHQAASDLPESVQVYTYKPTAADPKDARPFPIIMGSIQQTTALRYYPFEFTPSYVGCPPFFGDAKPPIGGGLVDPMGLNTPPPEPKPTIPAPILQAFNTNGSSSSSSSSSSGSSGGEAGGGGSSSNEAASADELMRLQLLSAKAKADFLVPLKMVAGISSSFLTSILAPGDTVSRELAGTEVLEYWNQVDFRGKQVSFADGASVDNTAITPLLRRRVSKIIACVAADRSVLGSSAEDWAARQWDISGLFGATPLKPSPDNIERKAFTGVPADLHNKKLQVFPTEGYQQLFDAVKRSTTAGGPSYHMATYTVMANPYQAIFGGWQVDVLWVINQQQLDWQAALPNNIGAALGGSSDRAGAPGDLVGGILLSGLEDVVDDLMAVLGAGVTSPIDLGRYPFIATGRANYSPGLTRLLSQQATWQLLQLQPQLQQLLAET